MNRDEFEQAFHSRTLAYHPAYRTDVRPVVVRLGPDARSRAGHTLLVALVNQLARAHQHIIVVGAGNEPLLCPPLFGLATVRDAAIVLAQSINPFMIAGTELSSYDPLATIALGTTTEPADLRVGCTGWCATFGPDATIGDDGTSALGAMLASCIAAAYAFHRLLGTTDQPAASYSLWDFGAPGTTQGPTFAGPLDVGRVLQVGAGGVGAALDYWASLLGIASIWTVVDGDNIEVSNLNRQLAFLAADAGFPDAAPKNKAEAAATLLGPIAIPGPDWYDRAPDTGGKPYDVVLALANERGIRALLQQRQPSVLLHATTSPYWAAQFHRHVAGADDCINCRIPTTDGPPTRCAETEIDDETSTDAALPFLSGAAGLMLLAGLIRLQHGHLMESSLNFMSLNLQSPAAHFQSLTRPCNDGCSAWAPEHVRARIEPDTRYGNLDPARRGAAQRRARPGEGTAERSGPRRGTRRSGR